MRDVLGPGTVLGYCTNVHAGATLREITTNLDRFSASVRDRVTPDGPLGIGLWLPASAARELRRGGQTERFARHLAARGLEVFTINGFPYGDFHQSVVKHRVYHPHWGEDARLGYTLDLIHVLAALAGPGAEGSISTLPVGWRADLGDEAVIRRAVANLKEAARAAAAVEQTTGALIHLDLEPEPGCLLDRSDDVVAFYRTRLFEGGDDPVIRRHLRVCHDVCHAAVMFEEQDHAVTRYAEADILIGKVQISSAVGVSFDPLPADARETARAELAALREPRYLHQTAVRRSTTAAVTLYDDLPDALAAEAGEGSPRGEWRVHFHVPIFLERVGGLDTTRDQIRACLAAVGDGAHPVRHYEIETYAWSVLPERLRPERLSDGIARELAWLRDGGGTS